MRKLKVISIEIISGLLILLFTYTAISKFGRFEHFRFTLSQAPAIGSFSSVLSWLLPSVEIITAALLFIPSTRRVGLVLSLALMLSFTGYIFYMVNFGGHLPCSCGGVLKRMTWKQHLVFNFFFTGLAAAGLILHKTNKDVIAINNRSSRIPV